VSTRERPAIRLAAFGALGLYGILRWQQLLNPAPAGRLVGLLVLAVALSTVATVAPRARAIVFPAVVLAALGTLAIAGLPLTWITHLRIAVIVNAIGEGLGALPRVLVPYTGINEWVRVVTLLGAGVLLFGAAAALSLAPRPLTDARRVAVALPLVALAVVPSTLARPHLAYLHGVLLFVLLAAFMWGERIGMRRIATALALAALAAAAGAALAPSLDPHRPWWNYQALAGSLSPGQLENFDWTQRYGPLNWPRTGREVFDVRAARPDYWKAEDLNVFDGHGWVSGAVQLENPLAGVDQAAIARWTQTLQITIRAMQTTDVIASGAAQQPDHLGQVVLPGAAPGTWTSGNQLGPGDSYTVRAYAPHPSAAELAAAGSEETASMPSASYLAIELPPTATLVAQPVLFAPFGSPVELEPIPGLNSDQSLAVLDASPYSSAFAIARRLASRASTPYAYVASVEHYLARGFRYDENPPQHTYPLLSFLFTDKVGYCQQFAGAMALLLRMGGIPARVAVGFTAGSYDAATRQYVVSDLDAHAWVEAWFPRFGWVEFDPTPTSAPARGGQSTLPALRPSRARPGRPHAVRRPEPGTAARRTGSTGRHSGGSAVAIVAVAALAIVLALLALIALRRPRDPSPDELVAELERALARCGRPATGGTTLASLERRFRASPDAAAYIRAIRVRRYGRGGDAPPHKGRRALRAQLRSGLGVLGRFRALWALPPRRS
jgi:transglutaminase-like putative cysteine protease